MFSNRGEEGAAAGGDEDLRSSDEVPALDLSWLGALHLLRTLNLQDVVEVNRPPLTLLVHLGGCASGGNGGTGSGGASRSPPPCLEELLLPSGFGLDGPSVHALAGLRHLTRLFAALVPLSGALAGRPPPPLTTTLRHIELYLWEPMARGSTLPMVAGLLAAKPPAALSLYLQFSQAPTALHLFALQEVVERVREVAWLRVAVQGLDALQVCATARGGAGVMHVTACIEAVLYDGSHCRIWCAAQRTHAPGGGGATPAACQALLAR